MALRDITSRQAIVAASSGVEELTRSGEALQRLASKPWWWMRTKPQNVQVLAGREAGRPAYGWSWP